VKIRDTATGTTFRSFSAGDFVVRPEKFANYLLAGFLIGSDRKGVVFQLNAWTMADLALPPLLYPCTPLEKRARRILFRLGDTEELPSGLVRVWKSRRNDLGC
jgi:hypothetical protein